MHFWRAIRKHWRFGRRHRRGAFALAALLLAIGLMPQLTRAQSALNAVQSRLNFDHLTTGFELTGQHRDLPCESCHVNAIFKGTPTDCGACHGIGTVVRATAKPRHHILSTDQCRACHTPAAHVPIGTPVTACESCHSPTNYTTWNPGVINHPAVSALTCASCHETANFQGMHPSTDTTAGDSRPSAKLDRLHPATGDCTQCHNTTSFLDPTVPRPSNHIPTRALCSQCHTTAGNWAVYSVTGTHQGVTGCLLCHGPNTGPFAGPPPGNTITIAGW